MSRTIPQEWSGPYNITEDKVEAIKEQYRISLGDEDKAGDPEDHEWYSGWRTSLEWVLNILYDKENSEWHNDSNGFVKNVVPLTSQDGSTQKS